MVPNNRLVPIVLQKIFLGVQQKKETIIWLTDKNGLTTVLKMWKQRHLHLW